MSQSDDDMPALLSESQLAQGNQTSQTTQSQANAPITNITQEQFTGTNGGTSQQNSSLNEMIRSTRSSLQLLESMVTTTNRMTTGPITELTRDSSGPHGIQPAHPYVPAARLLPTPPPIPPFPSLNPYIQSSSRYQTNDDIIHRERMGAVLDAAAIQAAMLATGIPRASSRSETTRSPAPYDTSNINGAVSRGDNPANDQVDGPLITHPDAQVEESVRALTNTLDRIAHSYRRNRLLTDRGDTVWTPQPQADGTSSTDPVIWGRRQDTLLTDRDVINETEAQIGRLIAAASAENPSFRTSRGREEPDYTGYTIQQSVREPVIIRTYDEAVAQETEAEREEGARWFTVAMNQQRLRKEKKKEKANTKAVNHLHYLTLLKEVDNNGSEALRLARELGLDSILISLIDERVHDLPMLIEELPFPQLSSWLEPGMGWSGKQSGGRNRSHTSARYGSDEIATGRLFNPRSPRLVDPSTQEAQPVDIEANIRQFQARQRRIRELNTRARFGGVVEPDTRPGVFSSIMTMKREWPVKVTINSVDWKNMSLIGTMTAINIPDGRQSAPHEQNEEKEEVSSGNSMESLFTGEIIDFRIHELETVKEKKDYTVAGIKTDLRYWAGVGPFRQAILREKEIRAAKEEEPSSSTRDHLVSSPKPERSDTSEVKSQSLDLGRDHEDNVIDEVMSRCLGSAKWIKENMSQWILMRWKEKCFLPPPTISTSTSASRNTSTPEFRFFNSGDGSTDTSFRTDTYGLTISGYYYIALNRQSGRIEGLYYDPRSQPFQRLELDPKDCCFGVGVGVGVDEENKAGLRRDFGVFEFR